MGDVGDEVAAEVGDALQFLQETFLGVAFAGELAVAGDEPEGEEQDEKNARGAEETGEDQGGAVPAKRLDDRLIGEGEAHDEVVPGLAGAEEHALVRRAGLADGAARAGDAGRLHLGAVAVVAGGRRLGVVDHAAGAGEDGEAEAVGSAGVGEVAEMGEVARDKGVLDAFRRKLGAGGEIALGPGLDGAAIAIRLRLENEAECDQANGGERAGKISERRLHGFTRYPTPRMVSMCAAQSPSFLRRPTSWTSTVRSVTDFSSSWTMSMIWARV